MTCDPQKKIIELKDVIGDMEGDIIAILDYAALLVECQPGPVINDDASGGVDRVLGEIREHARLLRQARTIGAKLVHELANP